MSTMHSHSCTTVAVTDAIFLTLLSQNELAILEFIHCLVETLDRYFSNVCELDLMFNLEMVRDCFAKIGHQLPVASRKR